MEHGQTRCVVVDPVEALQQPQRVRLGQQIARGLLGRGLSGRRSAVEQSRDRHTENVGDLGKPAGADPVRALLVFLHLLECYTYPPAELTLRQALLQPTDADVLTDQDVDRQWTSLRHLGLLFLSSHSYRHY